jgi:hypothetical protein
LFGRGQAKVCQFDSLAPVADEDILGFEVAMVDPDRVTELDGVEQL